jgi:membrane protease YdiL (CAAX protease family)
LAERDKTLAAVLFLATSLALPIVFSTDAGPTAGGEGDAAFLRQVALLQVEADAALELRLIPGGPAADQDGWQPLRFFAPDVWQDTARALDKEQGSRLLAELAAVCLAAGRDDDAARLLAGTTVPPPEEPFAWLFAPARTVEPSRLARDLEVSGLPGWVGASLAARALETGKAGPASPELLTRELGPFARRVEALSLALTVLLGLGIALLLFSARLLRRFAVPAVSGKVGVFTASPLETYIVFLAWFAAATGIGLALTFALEGAMSTAATLLVSYLLFAWAGLWLVRHKGGLLTESLVRAVDLERENFTFRAVAFGMGAFAVAVPVVLLLSILSAMLFGGGEGTAGPAIRLLARPESPLDRPLLLLNVGLIAPLFEELFFRGFLLQQMRRMFGAANGIGLSALVFAGAHQSIDSFLPLFALGVLFGVVYHSTRSLWASVAAHALWNLSTGAAILLLFD